MARAQGRVAAIALSGMFHILFFAWLIEQQHAFPAASDAPAMLVSLVPSVPHPVRPPAPAPVTKGRQRLEVHPAAATPQPLPPLVLPADPPERDAAAPDGFRQTLRGLVGCLPGRESQMGQDESQRCREQFAARARRDRGLPTPRLNLDSGGEFAASQNAEPYLQRRPRNGCKARAGGDTAPGPGGTPGKVGAATGISCAFSF
jgi:hypothetical protein